MNKRLSGFLQYYFINRKIQNLFPEANDYVYLSSVFPEKYKNSDKIVPVKYDKHGSLEKIFEERDFSGCLETEIIPIEYHSSYAAGIAELVKTFILDNLDFFKIFLSGYEKIVVDSNWKLSDDVFVVDNFTSDFSYTIENFLDVLLENYCVDLETRKVMIPKILKSLKNAKKSSNINYNFYLNSHSDDQVDFSCLVDLFLMDENYECLKTLLTTGNVTQARNKYVEENYFRIINDILNSSNYVPNFLVKYIDLLESAFKTTRLNGREILLTGLPKFKKNSTLNLVKALLKEFDPSGKFVDVFSTGLSKGEIILWNKDEKETLEKTVDTKGVNFVSVEMTGTILDTVKLVREFMRYYISTSASKDSQIYLSEILPSYYETKTKRWLKEVGLFDDKMFFQNENDDLITNTLTLFDLIHKKKDDGEISEDNIQCKEFGITCAKLLLASPVLKCDGRTISAVIGKYITDNFMSDDMDQRMLIVANSFSNKETTVDDMMDILVDGMKETKGKENTSVIQYVKIKVPPMVVAN